MFTNKRKRFLLHTVEDLIVDYVEDCIVEQAMTKEEGAWLYRTVGHRGLRGLFPHYLKEITNMQAQVILLKDENKIPPKEVISAAVEGFGKAIGIATVSDEEFIILREVCNVNADTLNEQMKMFTDTAVIACLSKEAEMSQPFVILGEDNKPELIAFIQGDASKVNRLRQKFAKERKGADSIETLWRSINDSEFEGYIGDEIKGLVPESTCIIFMNTAGGMVVFENGSIEKEHEWGASYGSEEPTDGGETIVEPKPSDGPKNFSSMSSKPVETAKPAVVATNKTEDKPAQRTAGVPMAIIKADEWSKVEASRLNKPSGAVRTLSNSEQVIRCPEQINGHPSSRQDNQKWHLDNFGVVPSNWAVKPYWPVGMMKKEVQIDLKTVHTSASQAALATTSKHIPKTMELDTSAVDDLKSNLLPKIFGTNTEVIGNPDNILTAEKAVKPIFAILGRNSVDEIATPWLGRIAICTERPDIAAHYWGDFQYAYFEMKKAAAAKIDELGKKITDLESALAAGTKTERKSFGSMK